MENRIGDNIRKLWILLLCNKLNVFILIILWVVLLEIFYIKRRLDYVMPNYEMEYTFDDFDKKLFSIRRAIDSIESNSTISDADCLKSYDLLDIENKLDNIKEDVYSIQLKLRY